MAKQKHPTHLEVTTCVSMIGPDRDEDTGRKIPVEIGTDCKMPYRLAVRLSKTKPPRVAITPELREQARKRGKAVIAKREAREKAAERRAASGPRR